MIILLPENVRLILKTLNNSGFESYIVGGCVRDSLLNRAPHDWDMTTNATPEEMIEVFKDFKVVPTGLQHGTLTIIIEGESYEVTTFRVDGTYSDNRRPDSVEFTRVLADDLSRRDFTINAMAYSPDSGLIDLFDGQKHLKERYIVAVGDADTRFNEDALRMMRAIRFGCQLDFKIHINILTSINRNKDLLKNISQERITSELNKILISDFPTFGIKIMKGCGLLDIVIPELTLTINFDQKNPHHCKDVFGHTLKVLDSVQGKLELRLSALFHDIAKPMCFTLDNNGIGHFYNHNLVGEKMVEIILKRMKYDNHTIDKVKLLVREHMSWVHSLKAVKRLMARVGEENINDLFELQIADIIGCKPPYDFSYVFKAQEFSNQIIEEKHPYRIKDLAVTGNDLIEAGVPAGKEIGETLKKLVNIVIKEPAKNSKEQLLDVVKTIQ